MKLQINTSKNISYSNMADDDTRRGDGGDAAPGIPFMNSFNVMEDVLDKLKLLDYETSFCKEWGFKSFPRYVFKCSKAASAVCAIVLMQRG